MSISTEKVAYLKGLMEGMDLDASAKETKLIAKIIDILDDFALEIEELQDRQDDLEAVIDELDEDLAELEEDYYECDCDDDCDCDCDCDDDDFVEIECPNCGETSYFDSSMLDEPELICPNCNESIYEDDDEE